MTPMTTSTMTVAIRRSLWFLAGMLALVRFLPVVVEGQSKSECWTTDHNGTVCFDTSKWDKPLILIPLRCWTGSDRPECKVR